MRSLPAPGLDHEALYRTCVGQTQSAADRTTLLDMTARVVAAGAAYGAAAAGRRLDAVGSMAMVEGERSLMRRVYDLRMSQQSGSGRAAYEELRSSAPLCPYCGYGEVCELDHFLPKTTFSELNVLPINLVPVCHACNHIKHEQPPEAEDRYFLHPYFDVLPNVRWLFATLNVESGGPVLSYRVALGAEHGALAARLSYHFQRLQLDRRFRTMAATMLVELEAEISEHLGVLNAQEMSEHFGALGQTSFQRHGNVLETAAYFAASESAQYCSGSYRN